MTDKQLSAPHSVAERNAMVEAEAQRLMAGRCPDDCPECYAAAEKAISQLTAPVAPPAPTEEG